MFNFKEMMGGFNLGEVKENELAMTMDGRVAVKRKDGEYVTYDSEKKVIVNNHGFVIDEMDGMFMIIPSQDVKEKDLVKIAGDYFYIDEIEGEKIYGINLSRGATQRINLVKEVSLMGFNFYNKVVSLASGFGQQGMNPMTLVMMKQMFGKDDSSSGNMMEKMFEMQMMSQMFGGGQNCNPMANMFGGMFGQSQQQTKEEVEEKITLTKEEYERLVNRQ